MKIDAVQVQPLNSVQITHFSHGRNQPPDFDRYQTLDSRPKKNRNRKKRENQTHVFLCVCVCVWTDM